MFHAQTWSYARNGNFMWTVNGRDVSAPGRRNARRVLRCSRIIHQGAQSYEIRALIPVGSGVPTMTHRIQQSNWYNGSSPNRVLTNLFNQGYLSWTGFEPIFNNPLSRLRDVGWVLDINPISIHDGFRGSRNSWPSTRETMLGGPAYSGAMNGPWHSPFLIWNGGIVPVTQPPQFPAGPVPHWPPPPPPPAPNPLPPSNPFRPEIFKPPSGGNDGNLADEGWNSTTSSNGTAPIAVAA